MEINLTEPVKGILSMFFLLILPWIFIVLGIAVNIENIIGSGWTAWYFLLSITWFGSGVVFFGALN